MPDREPRADAAAERVKPCLACGSVLPFDAEACSLCGAPCRQDAEEAVKPCLACGALLPAERFFCPECGDFALRVPGEARNVPPIGAREKRIVTALSRLVAVALLAGALVLLAASLIEFLRLRGLES